MANDFDWDSVHFGEGDNAPQPLDQDDDLAPRTFDSEEGLELSANKGDDDDMPLIPPPATEPTDNKPADDTPAAEDNMSGIELYLSQFDIEGGIINLDDGTSKHFNDLDAATQAEVLQQLHSTQAATVEAQFGLDESEISLLNYLRTNNLTVDEMLDAAVNERIAAMMSMQELAQQDYSKMDSDALYMKFLQESNPEATADQLAADLAKAKELSNFSKLTDTLRTQYVTQQETALAAKAAQTEQEHLALIESQRQEIVQAVLPMTEIAGIQLDNNIKNTVLDHILETNSDGESAFMDEIFAEPEKLFKAAFWYVYGDTLLQQRDEYWKREKSAAFKRGKEEALGVSQAQQSGRSFTAKPTEKKEPHTSASAQRSRDDDGSDWSDLYS